MSLAVPEFVIVKPMFVPETVEVIAPVPSLMALLLMLVVVAALLRAVTMGLPAAVAEIAVALPTEVTGPVRLAFVVTVAALPKVLFVSVPAFAVKAAII